MTLAFYPDALIRRHRLGWRQEARLWLDRLRARPVKPEPVAPEPWPQRVTGSDLDFPEPALPRLRNARYVPAAERRVTWTVDTAEVERLWGEIAANYYAEMWARAQLRRIKAEVYAEVES